MIIWTKRKECLFVPCCCRIVPSSDGLYSCNEENDTEPLVVNCVGEQKIANKFCTLAESGRLDYYFLWVTDGRLTVECADRTEDFTAGDAVIFYPRTRYTYRSSTDDMICYYFVHFTGYNAGKLAARCGFADHVKNHIGQSPELFGCTEELISAFIRRDNWLLLDCDHILTKLLVTAAKNSEVEPSGPRLGKSTAYIREHISDEIIIADLAHMENLSEQRYRCIFRERFKVSPKEYIITMRLEIAGQLIGSTDLPISRIAEMTGFSDALYFSRLFKNKTGKTPSELRKLQKI